MKVEIKPVAWVSELDPIFGDAWWASNPILYSNEYKSRGNMVALYDQSAIDALRAEVEGLRASLLRVLDWTSEIAGDNCDTEAAAEEIASIEQAKSAMQEDAQ